MQLTAFPLSLNKLASAVPCSAPSTMPVHHVTQTSASVPRRGYHMHASAMTPVMTHLDFLHMAGAHAIVLLARAQQCVAHLAGHVHDVLHCTAQGNHDESPQKQHSAVLDLWAPMPCAMPCVWRYVHHSSTSGAVGGYGLLAAPTDTCSWTTSVPTSKCEMTAGIWLYSCCAKVRIVLRP